MQKDFFHIPPKNTNDVKIYTSNASVDLQGFQIWQKPKGSSSIVSMFVVGSGGGGGGGFSRVAGNPGGGGGSGACSGLTRFVCPAIFLPDTLYIQVGGGGQGGSAGANGGSGLNSYVLTTPQSINTPNIICYSGVNVPGGGGGGSAGAAGAAGTVPSVSQIQPANIWGIWFSIVGLVGLIGGVQTGANGTSASIWAGLPVSVGSSGAGCTATDFNGGNISATAVLETSQNYYLNSGGGVALGGVAGVRRDGSGGVNRITPFYCSGGAGGASNNSGQAGNGGAGGYGCGGGGGGAGTTGGSGGNGGSGLIIIVTV